MCNHIHKSGYHRIPKTGIGWKIFGVDDSFLFTYGLSDKFYKKNEDGYIEWEPTNKAGGFCFFLDKNLAHKTLRYLLETGNNLYINHYVKRIEYYEGMIRQNEEYMIFRKTVEIALCKRFKILEVD